MKKQIITLTLCILTSLAMATPVAAATYSTCPKTSTNNVKISNDIQSLLSQVQSTNGTITNAKNCKKTVKIVKSLKNCKKPSSATLSNATKATCTTNGTCSNSTCLKNSVCLKNSTCVNGTCSKSSNSSCAKVTCVTNGTCTKSSCKTTTTPSSNQSTTTNYAGSTTSNTTPSATTPSTTTPSTTASNSSYSSFQKQVVALVNKERAAAGLSPLTEKTELDKVATLKSQDMVKLNYFSHTSPTYGSPFEMLTKYGINYSYAGENIAYGQSTPEEVMTGWMNSPGHRANILNANYTQIGVGVAKKANGQLYWTQTFTRP